MVITNYVEIIHRMQDVLCGFLDQSLVLNKPTTYVIVQAVDRPKALIYDCATASAAMLLRPFVIDAFLLDDSVQRMSDAVLQPRYQFLQDVRIPLRCNAATHN